MDSKNLINIKYLFILSSYFFGTVLLGPWALGEVDISESIFFALISSGLYFIAMIIYVALYDIYEKTSKYSYLKSAIGSLIASMLIFSYTIIYPKLTGHYYENSKYFYYGLLASGIFCAFTYFLLYLHNYVPSENIEVLKIKIETYRQFLYLSLLIFGTVLIGTLGVNILITPILNYKEIILLFYTAIGCLAFGFLPWGMIISKNISQIEKIIENQK